MQQRPATTDYLARVIQMLQLGKKTGILTIEHGEYATFEEAVLVFVNGQITEAKVGLRSGRNALNWLGTWSMCRFIFTAMPPPPPGLPAPQGNHRPSPPYAQPHPRTTQKLPALQTNTDPQQPRVTQKLPALPAHLESSLPHSTQKLPALPEHLDGLQARTTQKLTAIKLVKPVATSRDRFIVSENGINTPHPSPAPGRAALPGAAEYPQGGEARFTGSESGIYTPHPSSAPIAVTPYHSRPIDEAALRMLDERQLSRIHKHLLLLIDGRRTILDLMRLMGRSPDEMSRLLGDLRYLGLIGLRV